MIRHHEDELFLSHSFIITLHPNPLLLDPFNQSVHPNWPMNPPFWWDGGLSSHRAAESIEPALVQCLLFVVVYSVLQPRCFPSTALTVSLLSLSPRPSTCWLYKRKWCRPSVVIGPMLTGVACAAYHHDNHCAEKTNRPVAMGNQRWC